MPRQCCDGAGWQMASEALSRKNLTFANLGEQSPDVGCIGDAAHRLNVGRHTHRELALLSDFVDLLEAANHDFFQLIIDFCLTPEQPLQVLHPLKIRNNYAPGIA